MYNELLKRYPALAACGKEIEKAVAAIIACFEAGGKVLLCGNGGSAAACDHIAGEFTKGFLKNRPIRAEKMAEMRAKNPSVDVALLAKLQMGLPAISLPAMTALNTAFCNDVDPTLVYAQSVLALGKGGDVLIALSTSGNAGNVAAAAAVAKSLDITVIALTGEAGGALAKEADVAIRVPEKETYRVQEHHLPVYHYICAAVEAHFFQD